MKILIILILSLSLFSCSSSNSGAKNPKQRIVGQKYNDDKLIKGEVPAEYKDRSDDVERHHLRELYTIM